MPPVALSATHSGIDGPRAVAIGTTTPWSFAESMRIEPEASIVSASATVSAQPSATVAARIERRSGSQTRAYGIGGPACRRSLSSPKAGTTVRAGTTPVSMGVPESSLRRTSAFASSIAIDRVP